MLGLGFSAILWAAFINLQIPGPALSYAFSRRDMVGFGAHVVCCCAIKSTIVIKVTKDDDRTLQSVYLIWAKLNMYACSTQHIQMGLPLCSLRSNWK